MAPHCVRTIHSTRRSTPDVQPETRKRSTGLGNAAERGLNSVGAPSHGSPATKSTKTLLFQDLVAREEAEEVEERFVVLCFLCFLRVRHAVAESGKAPTDRRKRVAKDA
jgi:hypothetical protein